MAIVNVNSISGINSITAQSTSLNFYTAAGNNLPISAATLNVGTGASVSSPATNVLTLGTNNSERVRVDSSGNIGINTNTFPANGKNLKVSDETISRIALDKIGASARSFTIGNGGTYLNVYDETADVERVRIDSSGNLGIGTVSPSSMLHLLQSNGNAKITIQRSNTASNTDDYGSILWRSSAANNNGSIGVARESAENDGYMYFNTGSGGTLTERMRVDSSGRVTMPYQPIASLSDSRTNSITDAVLTSSNFYDTVWLNQGNHFNASTGRFTCPVAGVYRIYFRCSGTNAINVRLRKNGGAVNEAYSNTSNTSVSSEVVIRCNAGDYLDIQVSALYTIGGSQHKQVTFQLLY